MAYKYAEAFLTNNSEFNMVHSNCILLLRFLLESVSNGRKPHKQLIYARDKVWMRRVRWSSSILLYRINFHFTCASALCSVDIGGAGIYFVWMFPMHRIQSLYKNCVYIAHFKLPLPTLFKLPLWSCVCVPIELLLAQCDVGTVCVP